MAKPRSQYNPLIIGGEFVAPNRRTHRQFKACSYEAERVGEPPFKREEPKVMNGRTKKERKELAKQFGSKGTNLKKKHINRQRQLDNQLGK